MRRIGVAGGVFREARPVWVAIAAMTLAVLVTYARVPAEELYHVDDEGLAGGLGRALVFLNYPVALAAAPIALLAAAVLARRAATLAALGVVASASFVPFVVDQGDLDARLLNAVPALGTAVALVLTWTALGRAGRDTTGRLPADRVRLVLAGLLLVVAIPWYFAELGFYAPDPILADEPSPNEPIAAVHLGNHHGTNGVLLALAALALSRVPPRLPAGRLPAAASACLAALFAYGLANAVQDAWLEQIVKRGTTDLSLPSFVLPRLTIAWAALVGFAVLVELAWFRRERLGAATVPAPAAGEAVAVGPTA